MFEIIRRFFEKCATGCMPSPEDARDFIFRSSEPTKDSADLEPHLPTVLYQGNVPSCVAVATAHAVAIEERIRGLRRSTPSRRWIYYYARKRDNAVKTPLDGTYIRYALSSIRKLGCPPESSCKYSTKVSLLNSKPSGKAAMAAASRMFMRYEWITGDRCLNIRRALSIGHPVIFGTMVGESLSDYKTGQVLDTPKETYGGHAMCIIGYRRAGRSWEYKVLNSWRGREIVWFSEDYINWRQSHDFAIISGWEKVKP